ncbi:MAG: hypothetical protein N4A37_10625 [Prolixibacteraceae bacterium]|jgi:hypothetical protein|nr:hypothetical protein [Prolixibacteraceae bacterium]
MYRGFKLDNIDFYNEFDKYYSKGESLFFKQQARVKKSLNDFFLNDHSLDASMIIKSWFPEIKAHVFISHSHKDEQTVIALAGWLFDNFEIISFIDSCVWGYGNDLIQILDNQYSWFDKEKNIYTYNKVLSSTSHVHMMLSTALNTMIDKTECLMFYNTPNSIQPYENKDKTQSPWIYSEIAFSEIVRRQIPKRENFVLTKNMHSRGFKSLVGENNMDMKYDANIDHLVTLSDGDLKKWKEHGVCSNPESALDYLYNLKSLSN